MPTSYQPTSYEPASHEMIRPRSHLSHRMIASQLIGVCAVILAALASPARAADEEIEIYTDSQTEAGQIGLDLHTNYVALGEPGGEFSGGEASLHRFRLTPEVTYGVSDTVELGAYVPLLTLAGDDVVRAHGAIGRVKWIAPHTAGDGLFWGGNLEIGRFDRELEPDPWHAEIKGIVGVHEGRWTIALNPTIDVVLAGHVPSPAPFALNSEVSYHLTPGLAVAIESYNGLGDTHSPFVLADSEQATFATLHTRIGHWQVHWGAGLGYGGNRDHLIFLVSIGVPLPRLHHG